MKIIPKLLMLIIALQLTAFSQTKFEEYKDGSESVERNRMLGFLEHLHKNPEMRGIFVVYANENENKFGNILGYVGGVKKYISDKRFDISRIEFVIAKGKPRFTNEMWTLESGEKSPKFEKFGYDFDNLNSEYLYGSVCLNCDNYYEEFSPNQIDFEHLTQIVKSNPDYRILLRIGQQYVDVHFHEGVPCPKEYGKEIEKLFKTKYQLDKKRFEYEIIKDSETVEFYIVPTN